MPPVDILHQRGLTITDVAHRYRVKRDKVRAWIRRGELRAVNTAATACGKPRFVVTAEALAEFEKRRTDSPAKPEPRRRRRGELVDFFPD
jgi:excisionase family DNA binding protein